MSQSTNNSAPNQPHQDDYTVDFDVERRAEDRDKTLRDDANQNRLRNQWIFRRLRQSRGDGEDLPLKASAIHSAGSPATAVRLQAIKLVFGLPAEHASKWPGIFAFCRHLENCFEELTDPRFDIIWKLLQKDVPSAKIDGWHWCFAVINTFRGLQDKDASLEKAYERLVEDANHSLHEIKAHERIQVLRAMFAVICWISATLKPLLNNEATAATTDAVIPGLVTISASLAAENSCRKYITRNLKRPISKMFHSFRSQAEGVDEPDHYPSSSNTHNSGSPSNEVLHESSLNYSSLLRIGRVKLRWVDTLTAHLAFDRSTRTLSVFRFPSFCVTNILRKQEDAFLKSITAKLLPSHYYTDSPHEPSALYREVLLSYRLLFGQSSRSRKLLRGLLNHSLSSSSLTAGHPTSDYQHSSATSSNGTLDDIDPFLITIWTSPLLSRWRHLRYTEWGKLVHLLPSTIFPSSALDLNDRLQESDTYLAGADFPIFGPQLLTLQHYNMRQQPSKVKDLWQDQRNPLQWYTFWAVLWIGGASIVLAVLQLVVGIVQLYLAARPEPEGGKNSSLLQG